MHLSHIFKGIEILFLLSDQTLYFFEVLDLYLKYRGEMSVCNVRKIKVMGSQVYMQFPGVLKMFALIKKKEVISLTIGREYLNPILPSDFNDICIWELENEKGKKLIFWVNFLSIRVKNKISDFMCLSLVDRISKISNICFVKSLGGVYKFVMSSYDGMLYTLNRFGLLSGWDVVSFGEEFKLHKFGLWEMPYKERTIMVKEMENYKYVIFGNVKGGIFVLNIKIREFIQSFNCNMEIHDVIEERRDYPILYFYSVSKKYNSLNKFKFYQKDAEWIYKQRNKDIFPVAGLKYHNELIDKMILNRKPNEEHHAYYSRLKRYENQIEQKKL